MPCPALSYLYPTTYPILHPTLPYPNLHHTHPSLYPAHSRHYLTLPYPLPYPTPTSIEIIIIIIFIIIIFIIHSIIVAIKIFNASTVISNISLCL